MEGFFQSVCCGRRLGQRVVFGGAVLLNQGVSLMDVDWGPSDTAPAGDPEFRASAVVVREAGTLCSPPPPLQGCQTDAGS